MQTEQRYNSSAVEVRQRGRAQFIEGHAAVFWREGQEGTEYRLWEDVVERIMPGAFDRALKEDDDARALFNHDPNYLLGRVSAGSLRLSKDATGLRYSIDVDPDDPDHARLLPKITRGDLSGSSFGFRVEKATWIEEEDRDIRQLEQVALLDVSPVTYPAYEATDVGLRGAMNLDEVRTSWRLWKAGEGHTVKAVRRDIVNMRIPNV